MKTIDIIFKLEDIEQQLRDLKSELKKEWSLNPTIKIQTELQ